MRGLLLATGMFSVVPVPAVAADHPTAAAALRWLPLVGAVLGSLAAVGSLVFWRGGGAGSALLGATVAVVTLALLTRGLHLDGLADLADGLGSGHPAPRALEIMREPDIGPFGVAAVVAVLLLQVTALSEVLAATTRTQGVLVLVVVTAGARLAALDAARPAVPPARPGGFGALVAGSAPARRTGPVVAAMLAAGWAVLVPTTSVLIALWVPGALVLGLLAARVVGRHAVRRLGGITGDVFGALVEVTATVALLVLAAVLTWRGAL